MASFIPVEDVQTVLVLSLAASTISVKNGDYMEFYVSAENLPNIESNNCGILGSCTGTGRFGYLWMSGYLMTGGRLKFHVKVDSELIQSKSPVWINDIRNITVINNSPVSWSRQRMFVYEEARTPRGQTTHRDIVGMYYMDDYDLEGNIAKSCDTNLPFKIAKKAWSDSSKTVTLLFHCTKFVPK